MGHPNQGTLQTPMNIHRNGGIHKHCTLPCGFTGLPAIKNLLIPQLLTLRIAGQLPTIHLPRGFVDKPDPMLP